jgi:hypothetical protein
VKSKCIVGFHDGVMLVMHPLQSVSSMRGCHSREAIIGPVIGLYIDSGDVGG